MKVRINKWLHVFYLQGNYGYGHGWEDLCGESTFREARERKKEYQENEGGTYRIIKRRELNPEYVQPT